MTDEHRKEAPSAPRHSMAPEALTVQDALLVLAIRLIGSEVRSNSSARRHIIALARSTPLLMGEAYGETEKRLKTLSNWAGTAVMDELFARALAILRSDYRREALAWASVNAVAQQETAETNALLYHIGKALGFTPSEVEASLVQALNQSGGATKANRS